MTDVEQDAIAVAQIRAALPEVVAIYRFGSTVDGSSGPQSDVDLAVLTTAPLDPLARFDLQERLATALHRSADLVDLRAASTVMAMQVVSTGVVLFDGVPESRGAFEDRTFSSYARLNEERRGILERIAAEGSVYG